MKLRRFILGSMALLGAALLLNIMPIRAFGDTATVYIYMYNSQGVLVNETGIDTYQSGAVYGPNGNLIGTVPDFQLGHVYDTAGNTIGYVTSS